MLDWVLGREHSALFVAPGKGKTVVTLAAIERRILDGSPGALVISPIRVAGTTWPDQAAQWDHSSWLRVVNLNTPEGVEAWETGGADIYLSHYDMLASSTVRRKQKDGSVKETYYPGHAEKFLKRKRVPVDQIIWDELSYAKSHSSKRPNAVRAFNHHFKYRIGLTGTPVANSYMDLFAQARLLDDGKRLGTHITRFRERYFTSDYMGFNYELRPGAKEQIDEALSDLALVITDEDEDDGLVSTFETITVKLPPEALDRYRTFAKELLLEVPKGEITAASAAVLSNKLLQFTSGAIYDEDKNVHVLHTAKVDALVALRNRLGDAPLLVITAYQHEKDRICAAIPGAVPFHERDIHAFGRGEIKTWVAQVQQLSHGIDGLQRSCQHLCWFTSPWSHERDKQTNARIIRDGQSAEVHIYRLIVPKSIDEAVVETLAGKSATEKGLLKALKRMQAEITH